MARKRKIGGEIFELLKYAPSKNSANRTAEKEGEVVQKPESSSLAIRATLILFG